LLSSEESFTGSTLTFFTTRSPYDVVLPATVRNRFTPRNIAGAGPSAQGRV
jgi:hypothetical protein